MAVFRWCVSAAAVAAAAFLGWPGAARALDAASIFQQAEQVRSPGLDYTVDFTLHVTDPSTSWKERTARYTMIAHGKDHSLVLMREPEQFYPGTLLIADGLYWLLLPRSTRSFQLSPRHVLNGDISNGDLARGNLSAYYTARLDGEESIRGDDCYRLELERTNNLGMYKRIRYWVTRDGLRPRKFEYYGHTDTLLKTAWYEDYREGAIGLRSMRIEVASGIRPGEHTTLSFENLRRVEASALPYDRDSLATIRDAALARLEDEGRQVPAEELIELVRNSQAAPPRRKRGGKRPVAAGDS